MKVYKPIQAALILLITVIFLTSCSEDEGPGLPSFNYTETSIDAIFSESGNSSAPTGDWNGDIGSFALSATIDGLSINSATGVLSWSRLLEPGDHDFEVIIANSAGQTTINLTISNPFQGIFTGTYNTSIFYEMEFNTDGTVEVRADNPTTPNLASGTWSLTDNTLSVDYTYDLGGDFSTTGPLTQSTTNAINSGDWYRGHGTVSGTEGGVFEIILN